MTLSLRVCLLESRIQRDVNSILKRLMDHVRGFITSKSDNYLTFKHGDMTISLFIEPFEDQDVPIVQGSYSRDDLGLTLYMRPGVEQLPEIKKELMITLYHELEHAAQAGDLGSDLRRHRSQSHMGPIEMPTTDDSPKPTRPSPMGRGWLRYHFSPWEQEARVTELARLAKLEHVPLTVVFQRFADEMVKGNELSRRQADMLVKDWEAYAARRGFGKKKSPKRMPVPSSM